MSLLRSTLSSIKAYVPTPPQQGHRLHLNESPTDLPPELKAAAVERLLELDWSRYPEETELLQEELAQADGWRRDGILLGNGSNEMLQITMFATLSPGDAVVFASPSFSLYTTQAKAAGANILEVPLRTKKDEPFAFDIPRLIRAATMSNARLVLVATPNNPTGTLLSPAEVKQLHDGVDCLVAVDEAYRHFSGQDLVPLLKECPRLILLRTFSKSFAAAALRLGYLLADPAICTELHKVQMPYNLGAISASLARQLLKRPQLVEERTRFVVTERDRMAAAMREMPHLRVEHPAANFVVVEHATQPATELTKELARRGVLVRDLTGYVGCERCLRISVGTTEANDALIRAMREVA